MNSEILELESYNNLAQTRLESQNIFKNHTTLLYVHTRVLLNTTTVLHKCGH